jgi:hypothetical protein
MDDLTPLPTRLRALAGELVRLQPNRTDPERYHIEKDRIATELRRAAVEADWTRPKPAAAPAGVRDRPDVRSPAGERNGHPALPGVLRAPVLARPVIEAPSIPAGGLPAACRHCRRRQAQQSYRHRLRLPTGDLFAWAEARDVQ